MTVEATGSVGVRQLRVVVRAEDFERAVSFYRDALGLPEQAAFEGDGGAQVAILDAGRATLELANPQQAELIDGVEAEGRPSDRIRVAFEVGDAAARTDEMVAAGAELLASPRVTPWRSLNSRLRAPAGLQVTLFEELESLEQRSARDGFSRPVSAARGRAEGGGVRLVQRLEGAAVGLLALVGTVVLAPGLWWFPLAVFLLFDLSALGYLRSARVGAFWYNAVHNYVWPVMLGTAALVSGAGVMAAASAGAVLWLWMVALAWAFHVGVDRALGYGLKHPDHFQHTHLGWIGGRRSS